MTRIKDSFFGGLDAILGPILMLLVTPIFISALGLKGYAIWVLVNSITAFLAIFNFGSSEVVTKFVSSNLFNGTAKKIKETFSTVFFIQTIVLFLIYLLFLIGNELIFPLISSENSEIVVEVLFIAIPIFFIKQSEELLYAFLKGYEQFGQVLIMSSISKILFFSAQVYIALKTRSIADVFYAALAVSTVIFFLQSFYLKKIHSNSFSYFSISLARGKEIFSFFGWSGLSGIVYLVRSQSDKWLVSLFLGLETFGLYSLGVMIFNQIHRFLGSTVYWVFPEVSKNSSNKKLLISRYWTLIIFISITSLLISLFLGNAGFLFEAWLGNETYRQSLNFINIFLIILPVYTLNIVSELYLLGLGLVKKRFFIDLLTLIIKVLTIWVSLQLLELEDWIQYLLIYIVIEYIYFAKIISDNLNIGFHKILSFIVIQLLIVFIRLH